MNDGGCSLVGLGALGRFGANVGGKILVTLGFVLGDHFMKRVANERA